MSEDVTVMDDSTVPRIRKLKLEGIQPFHNAIEFEFDDSVNLFIGPNGTGKSTIMQTLSSKLGAIRSRNDLDSEMNLSGDGYRIAIENWSVNQREPVVLVDFPATRIGLGTSPPRNPASYKRGASLERQLNNIIGSSLDSVIREMSDPAEYDYDPVEEKDTLFAREVGGRLQEHVMSRLGKLPDVSASYFDGSEVYATVRSMGNQDAQLARLASAAITVYDCVRDICREIVAGERPRNFRMVEVGGQTRLGTPDETEELLSRPREYRALGVETAEGSVDPLYLGWLSTGTQGTFLWVWKLAFELGRRYNFKEGDGGELRWNQEPGILFIDEIENHLHPTWQRRVIPAIRRHFPGLQIFATTHSPFVVAGLKKGQVHKLYKRGGEIRTPTLDDEEREHRIVGWTVEEILRDFMEVDDPTDEDTAEAAAALRWLQRQDIPDDPGEPAADWIDASLNWLKASPSRSLDEEAVRYWLEKQERPTGSAKVWRETTVEELRDIVSSELEAGGPIAAQREMFLRLLEDMLADESHEE